MKKYTLGLITGLLLSLVTLSAVRVLAAAQWQWRDVSSNAWYYNAVSELAGIGVVSGYPDGSYGPANAVTRAEVAQMLYRMKQYVDARDEGKTVSMVAPTPVVPVANQNVVASTDFSCTAVTMPAHATEVVVSTIAELKDAITQANVSGNTIISMRDGTYVTDTDLWITANDVVVRSQSGNREKVILKGQGMRGGVASVLHLMGTRDIVADVTIGWVANHPIQIHGEKNADAPVIHNVHFVDGYEQLLKISYDAAHAESGSDNGVVECSLFEYSAGIGPQYYIGGVDAHNARNWIVRGNTFKNIRSPDAEIAEHAIHFWSNSQGTLVENNVIINSDRGVGFGLGDRGHVGGIIRNNFIYHDAHSSGDVGIALESSPNTQVYGNKIYFENDYKNAIEYRFGSTSGVLIHDNISNKAISARDGATGTLTNNTTNAMPSVFAAEVEKAGM